LAYSLKKIVDRVHLDPLNYPNQVRALYKKLGWESWLYRDKFEQVKETFESIFKKKNIN